MEGLGEFVCSICVLWGSSLLLYFAPLSAVRYQKAKVWAKMYLGGRSWVSGGPQGSRRASRHLRAPQVASGVPPSGGTLSSSEALTGAHPPGCGTGSDLRRVGVSDSSFRRAILRLASPDREVLPLARLVNNPSPPSSSSSCGCRPRSLMVLEHLIRELFTNRCCQKMCCPPHAGQKRAHLHADSR